MTVKGFFKGMWDAFRYLFLTPAGGSKRRKEQQEYEQALEEGRLAEVERQKLERRGEL